MEDKQQKSWLRRRWADVATVVFIALMLIPQTRMPIIVFVQRTFAFGPSTAGTTEQVTDYQWPLKDMDGKNISFEQSEGKVVFVNFWATWCPPCVAEMPYMQNLYNDYKDQVDFYFVTDEKPERIQSFMERHEYDLPIQIQQYAAPEPMEAKALPTTYVLGKNGNVHIKKKGSARWDSQKVRNLLDKLLQE